jgi:23S rRNA (uracil1939-C5)-methyltransferase
MHYEAQLAWKRERVRGALESCGLGTVPVEPTIGCENPWRYRNHMRFSVNREGRAGLTARGSHRVLEATSCHIAHQAINDALAAARDIPLGRPQFTVRVGAASHDILLQPPPPVEVTRRLTALGLTVRDTEMEERLLGVPFRIRPSSFFQTNTAQANQMARIALEQLPSGSDIAVVDAYCGVGGTFAALIAGQVGRVIAIEESASSVRDARWNLRQLDNVEIVQAKVEDALPRLGGQIDGLVIDPPRAGCQRSVLDTVIARRVARIVYVSCSPDTLARDLAVLSARPDGYRVARVQPLDMFPQTAHVETIATLEVC